MVLYGTIGNIVYGLKNRFERLSRIYSSKRRVFCGHDNTIRFEIQSVCKLKLSDVDLKYLTKY